MERSCFAERAKLHGTPNMAKTRNWSQCIQDATVVVTDKLFTMNLHDSLEMWLADYLHSIDLHTM